MFRNLLEVNRLAIIIGGFLILAGMILLGIFALTILEIFNPEFLIERDFITVLMVILVVVGALDLISGIILFLR